MKKRFGKAIIVIVSVLAFFIAYGVVTIVFDSVTDEYPSSYNDAFVNACTAQGAGGSYCQCALDYVKANYTFEQARSFEAGGLPEGLVSSIQSRCY